MTLLEKLLVYVSCGFLLANGLVKHSTFAILAFCGFIFSCILLQLFIYNNNIHLSLLSLLRFTFPFLLFICLNELMQMKKIELTKVVRISLHLLLFLAVFSILFGFFSGFGEAIGGRGSNIEGGKGFFVGANEVGILLILLIVFSNSLSNIFYRNTAFFCIIVCGLIVLTKSSLIASLAGVFYLILRYKIVRNLLIITLFFVFVYYSEFIILNVIEKTSGTFLDFENQSIINLIFRGRQNYVDAFFFYFDSDNPSNLIRLAFIGLGENYIADLIAFGIGIDDGMRSTFEADFLDLFFSLGFLITFCCITLYAVFLRSLFKHLYFKDKMLITLIVLHSVLAGHVVFSPMITVSIVLLYFYIKVEREKQESNMQ